MIEKFQKPYKIGLTGGIACGKSLVRKFLFDSGIESIDADEIVHDILQNDSTIIQKITDLFGTDILKEDGGIDRKKLAIIVFPDPEKLKKLENIIHPETYKRINSFINNTKNDIVVVVIPLLFETNRQGLFDSVWLVKSDTEHQIDRLKLRDDMSKEEANQRIASQMPQELKIALANIVIENTSSIEDLENNVKSLIDEIRSKF